MKQLFCFFLSLVLIISLSSVTFSDSVSEYNWDDVGLAILNSFSDSSVYCKVDDVDISFWIPNYFSIVPLTEEDHAQDCIGYLLHENGSAFMLLYYTDMPVSSLDTLLSFYVNSGFTARKILVNGVPAVLQEDADNNSLCVCFQTAEDKLFQVIFYPGLDSNYRVIFDLIIASIMPNESLFVVSDTGISDESEPVTSLNPVSGLISK